MMERICNIQDCDRICVNHSGCVANIATNTVNITNLEDATNNLIKDVARMQGRMNILITVASILLTTLISVSTFSAFQIMQFKNEYSKDKQEAIEQSFIQEKAYIELLNKLGERVSNLERAENRR